MSRKCRTINCADPAVYGDLYCWRCRDEIDAMAEAARDPKPKTDWRGIGIVIAIIVLATVLAVHRSWSGL